MTIYHYGRRGRSTRADKTFTDIRVIKIGKGVGVIIPQDVVYSYGLQIGDRITCDIKNVDSSDRYNYQKELEYKKKRRNRW